MKIKIEADVFTPKRGDDYYYITDQGYIKRAKWAPSEGYTEPLGRQYAGNCFGTEKEAEAMAEKFKEMATKKPGKEMTFSEGLDKTRKIAESVDEVDERCWSIVKTKLEEAELWARRASDVWLGSRKWKR